MTDSRRDDTRNYDDLIDYDWNYDSLPNRMPLSQRAKIFLPFAALTGFDEALDHLSDLYGKDDCRYYVVEDDAGRVIGGVGFSPCVFIDGAAELQKLYLADDVKGAGLGYEMMDFIEDRMKDARFSISYLETHTCLETAIHIYEKTGYVQIDRPKQVIHSTMDRFYKKTLK